MASGKPYSPQVKAQALARLAAGESVHAVSRGLGISRSTLTDWRRAIDLPVPVAPQKRQDLSEELWGLLYDSIHALRCQLAVFADPEYIKKQSAHDMAILHGVITDKAGRLLASAAGSGDAGGGPGAAGAGADEPIDVG